MDDTSSRWAGWFKGTTLAERVRALKAHPPEEGSAGFDEARAERRLSRWRSRALLERDDIFAERLALDGVTEQELRRLLGESAEALAARMGELPDWARRILHCYEAPETAGADLGPLLRSKTTPTTAAFLLLLEPLLAEALGRLEAELGRVVACHPEAPFSPRAAVELCLPHLVTLLGTLLNRTLVLELNVARVQGQLRGESAQERFDSFAARLRQRDVALAMLTEYPVMARRALVCLDRWVATSLELLERLAADMEAVRATLSPERAPGSLVACEAGAGDPHQGGRSVAVLTFSSGLRVVYKPRSLAVDSHFQRLLLWLNERGATPAFKPLGLVAREAYGWVEFVEHRTCESPDEVRRFYERQGGYLAVLYVLESTDMHFENIIASGEHPLLIDLEALFHSHFQYEGGGGDELAEHALGESVLRVGLLPKRQFVDESGGLDFSGLGNQRGQVSRLANRWDQSGTDEMRMVRRQVEVGGGTNRPTLQGADVDVLDYTEPLLEGFSRMYRLLLSHREALLAQDGPLSWFGSDETRVILRPTYFYHLLHREGAHPDHFRDGLDMDRFFDRLWGTVERIPYTRPLIRFERDEQWNNDIPSFHTHPLSRDIWSSTGERLADFLPVSGMELARGNVVALSEEGLAQQCWIIRGSLTALSVSAGLGRVTRAGEVEREVPATRERLLQEARALGDRLSALALRGEGSASWLGISPMRERYWRLSPLEVDLHSGLSGILFFLAWLGKVTGEERYTTLAREALGTVRRRLDKEQALPRTLGAFGDSGVLYALTHLGALWDEPALWDEAEALLPRLSERVAKDEHLDIFSGAAGCLAVLLVLHRTRPSPRVLELAVRCGERLLETARPMERGHGWVTSLGPRPLTGLSHGTAGIAWALLSLAEATGQARFHAAAQLALEYERAHFQPEAGNWSDLRADVVEGRCMTAICHGAPGIGLARLLSLPYLGAEAERARAEIQVAVATTLATGFGGNHSLCHGDSGNLEFLVLAEQVLGDVGLGRHRERLAATLVGSLEQSGPLCGVALGVETPGLLMGLAGIGYGLLRLAAPAEVPSLLALEPPFSTGGARLAAGSR